MNHARAVGLALFAAVSSACHAPRVIPMLRVAVSPDIPPFIFIEDGAARGIEIDIVRQALPAYELTFIQLPYDALQSAVAQGKADVAVGVQHFADDGAFYSRDLVAFENAAITKKSAGLRIDRIADLAEHPVLTWQDAWMELGAEFEALFAPDAPQRALYVEVADQAEQVRLFWAAETDVIVVDRNIFDTFSKSQGHSTADVDYHLVFPPTTDFKAAFEDAGVRDAFDSGLTALCRSGDYAGILARYDAHPSRTICDR